jgi:hypothetical protein
MKINKKYHWSNFFLCQKLKSRVTIIQLKPILRYFLAWFQSLQLPSTQSENSLAPKSHASLCPTANRIFHFSYFDPD